MVKIILRGLAEVNKSTNQAKKPLPYLSNELKFDWSGLLYLGTTHFSLLSSQGNFIVVLVVVVKGAGGGRGALRYILIDAASSSQIPAQTKLLASPIENMRYNQSRIDHVL